MRQNILLSIVLLNVLLPDIVIQTQAQSKVDSLYILLKKDKEDTIKVNHLNNLCVEYRNILQYDTALYYGNAALQLAEQLNFKKGAGAAYNDIGTVYYKQGEYDKALENYFAFLKTEKELSNKQGIYKAYNNIGLIYYEQGNYDKALENYFASLKVEQETGDEHSIGISYNNIGLIYYRQGNYDKALENQLASLEIKQKTGDKSGQAVAYINIGTIYSNQGKYDKALENYFASLKIKKEVGDKQGIASSYNNIGIVYYVQGDSASVKGDTLSARNLYNKALNVNMEALKIFDEIEDKYNMGGINNNIGMTYEKLKQPLKALQYCNKGLLLAKEVGAKNTIEDSYLNLSEICAGMHDYKSAYKYYNFYSQVKDSIFNEKSSKQLAEMQTRYETDKQKKEIKLLKNENEIKALKMSDLHHQLFLHRIFFIILILVGGVLIAITWLLISRNRIRQKEILKTNLLRQQEKHTKAIIETQEQERKRIAQDLHDGIGHKLAAAKINFEKIADVIPAVSGEQKNIIKKIETILDETYKEVRTLSHSMMPKALQEKELESAVSDLVEETLAPSNIKYHFENNLPPSALPEDGQVCLYRVLQELLSNILKHAQATEISIQLFENNNSVILMVEDNGIGIKQEGNTTGIGLQNIAGRISAVHGIFRIESSPQKGTIATIRIPV